MRYLEALNRECGSIHIPKAPEGIYGALISRGWQTTACSSNKLLAHAALPEGWRATIDEDKLSMSILNNSGIAVVYIVAPEEDGAPYFLQLP